MFHAYYDFFRGERKGSDGTSDIILFFSYGHPESLVMSSLTAAATGIISPSSAIFPAPTSSLANRSPHAPCLNLADIQHNSTVF
jgi:hypothetical protein